jgi:hypothetical protein
MKLHGRALMKKSGREEVKGKKKSLRNINTRRPSAA